MYHNLVFDQMFDTNPLLQTTNLFAGPGLYQAAARVHWPDSLRTISVVCNSYVFICPQLSDTH